MEPTFGSIGAWFGVPTVWTEGIVEKEKEGFYSKATRIAAALHHAARLQDITPVLFVELSNERLFLVCRRDVRAVFLSVGLDGSICEHAIELPLP